ncbi:hypothetical protein O181_120190, partial [Austropuccinia psidii MF-1]|nr:hypothetical protein [Austropuccinia psidii MF-1]
MMANLACGDFRALSNYTKAERYPIARIPHALEKMGKAKCITKIDCMKGLHQNGVKKIHETTQNHMPNAPAHFQRMMDTIFQEEILEGWMV